MMMRTTREGRNSAHNNKSIMSFAWDFALIMLINDEGFMWIEWGIEIGLPTSDSYEIERSALKMVVFFTSVYGGFLLFLCFPCSAGLSVACFPFI